jgi:sortase A
LLYNLGMNKRRILQLGILFIVLASTVVFARTLVSSAFYAPEREVVSAQPLTLATTSASLPARLVIPALEIDAEVEHVGINYKGEMVAPADYDDVAWYREGVVPGKRGSAVMAGHLNDGLGLSGVFQDLQKIEPGDEVFVENGYGRIRFVVEQIETYDYKSVPLDLVFHRSDAVRLNLITCAGRWTWDGRTYDKRVVVYAKYVGEPN